MIAVEGKAKEQFGDTVGEWRGEAVAGKEENRLARLAFVQKTIGLSGAPVDGIRYQLLHRTAAAVLEAGRFHARYAAMVVHSFSADRKSFGDYEAFVALYDARAEAGGLTKLCDTGGVELYAGWATGIVP